MIPVTNLHHYRVLLQVHYNLLGVQRDMHRAATAWAADAASAVQPATNLSQAIASTAAELRRRLQWTYADEVADLFPLIGSSRAEVAGLTSSLLSVVELIEAAPKATHAEAASLAAAVLAIVPPNPSLWPE